MPVGHILTIENIKNILVKYPNTLFVVDEAYIEFSDNFSCSFLTEIYNNLIVVRTFSKFFSLASLRLGYLITNPFLIKLLKPYYNYKDITKLSVNCATKSLLNINFYENNKQIYFNLKSKIKNNLDEIIKNNDNIYDYIMNDGMYFTLICKEPEKIKLYFDNHSVAVRNKNSDITGAIRLTINTEEILDIVFDLLKKFK
jgi:histidinol-phosphate aminotransferase